MLARLADSYYWMSRYLERIENYARFMDVNFHLILDYNDNSIEQWKPLIEVSGDNELYLEYYHDYSKQNVLFFLSFCKENQNSIYNSVLNLIDNAKQARPELPIEIWEQVNCLKQTIIEGRTNEIHKCDNPSRFFGMIKSYCYMINGAMDNMMERNEAHNFSMLGKHIERSDKTLRVLDVKYHMILPENKGIGTSYDLLHWVALLKSVGGYEIYLKKYGSMSRSKIVQFLLYDEGFPRSIMYNLNALKKYNSFLNNNGFNTIDHVGKKILFLMNRMSQVDTAKIIINGLHEFISDLISDFNNVSNEIVNYYFINKDYLKVHFYDSELQKDKINNDYISQNSYNKVTNIQSQKQISA